MTKKVICCVHDKKSDTFEGFMAFNNPGEAIRSFEMTCSQNETFRKWPEDFQFLQIGHLLYKNGEIDNEGNITEKGDIIQLSKSVLLLAEAKDFVKNEKPTK